MKLSDEEVSFIDKVVKTAKLVNIDSVVIDAESVRGIDEDKTVLMLEPDVPELSCGTVGLSNLNAFTTRINVVRDREGFNITTKMKPMDGEPDQVYSLIMKAKGVSVDFKCSPPSPSVQSAPRNIKDPAYYSFTVDSDTIDLIKQSTRAMKTDVISIISNDTGLSFEVVDVNHDIFKTEVEQGAVSSLNDEGDTRFVFKYILKSLVTAFSNSDDGVCIIGKKGVLSVTVDGLTIKLIPKV